MKLIYLAGPFRAEDNFRIQQNILDAEAVAYAIITESKGAAAVLCPHALGRNFIGTFTDDYWLAATMEMLKRCDAVYSFCRWRESAGTKAEVEAAEKLGLPVFYSRAEVLRFVGVDET